MEQLIGKYLPVALLGIAFLIFTCLVLFFRAYRKFNQLNSHLEEMLSESGHDLPGLVNQYLSAIEELREANAELNRRVESLETWKPQAVQQVALKRYNAFDGVGGDQSFSLALVKGTGEGIILSGLYGRDETRVYAKPVKNGASPYPLSDEEAEALEAIGKGKQ